MFFVPVKQKTRASMTGTNSFFWPLFFWAGGNKIPFEENMINIPFWKFSYFRNVYFSDNNKKKPSKASSGDPNKNNKLLPIEVDQEILCSIILFGGTDSNASFFKRNPSFQYFSAELKRKIRDRKKHFETHLKKFFGSHNQKKRQNNQILRKNNQFYTK